LRHANSAVILRENEATNIMNSIRGDSAKPMLSDIELVERAKRGDTRAFEEIIRKYQDQVFRFVLHMLPSRQDAEDTAQETFIKAYRNIGKFRGDASLGTWLIAIARKTVAQWYRGRKAEHSLDQAEEPVGDDTDTLLAHLEIRSAVAKLPELYREVVVLRYANQLDLNEISAATGLSRNAVGVRLHRARQMLRDALGAARPQEVCPDEL
jgi:RNA polymerase sigma-70 factor (ECF subfamily)